MGVITNRTISWLDWHSLIQNYHITFTKDIWFQKFIRYIKMSNYQKILSKLYTWKMSVNLFKMICTFERKIHLFIITDMVGLFLWCGRDIVTYRVFIIIKIKRSLVTISIKGNLVRRLLDCSYIWLRMM